MEVRFAREMNGNHESDFDGAEMNLALCPAVFVPIAKVKAASMAAPNQIMPVYLALLILATRAGRISPGAASAGPPAKSKTPT